MAIPSARAKPVFSDTALLMIGAQAANWPGDDSPMWAALRDVVHRARAITKSADLEIAEVFGNRSLSDLGRLQGAALIALDAIAELEAMPELTRAEALVNAAVDPLDRARAKAVETKPTGPHEVALQAEIREHLRGQKEPFAFALKRSGDLAVVQAVAAAPAYLSGLTDEEKNIFLARASTALWPDETARREQAAKALAVARQAVRQAIGRVAERGQLQETSPGKYEASAAVRRVSAA